MSKINATYSSGYYIAPDVDFRKLEEQQRQEQRGKRRKPGADSAETGDNVKRQTFAIPFDLICLHCNRRIARGSHVYTNRRATDERYLHSIRIWELEILCRFCKGKYYLRTDPETAKDTGGYICVKGCKRAEGDFYDLNRQNKAAREEWRRAKADAELDPLAALEEENEAVRQLEERNRQIEEEVERQAGHNDSDLLTMLRNRTRRSVELAARHSDDNSLEESDGDDDLHSFSKQQSASTPSSVGLPPPPTSNSIAADRDGTGDGEDVNNNNDVGEDVEERSYREFEEDMERRWRALEREQRAQRRMAQESATAKPIVQAREVDRVLARYRGLRDAPSSSAVENINAPCADAPSLAPARDTPTAVDDESGVRGGSTFTVSAAPPVRRNKFLIEDEEGDCDADVPQRAPLQRTFTQASRPAVSTVKSASVFSSMGNQGASTSLLPFFPSKPRVAGGNALLRNLVDSDDDDIP